MPVVRHGGNGSALKSASQDSHPTGGHMSAVIEDQREKDDKTLTMVIYGLYAGGLLTGITYLVAVVINYVKRDSLTSPLLQSHFRWQIRTFWFSLLWSAIGVVLCFVIVGFFILFANLIWFIYRIVKGFLNLNENKPMYAD
jgi:uncharacterized membrane protein